MSGSRIILVAMVGLVAATTVQATTWVADFTSVAPESWTGSDGTAVAGYTDTTGANPNTFVVVGTPPTNLTPGWITQGDRGGVPTTVKFWNPAGDGKSNRARFGTSLPTSMNADAGVSVGWTARYGSYAIGRGPIQVAVTSTGANQTNGGVEYNVYFNVQNGTTLRIQSNGGGLYGGIDPLTIPNAGDGQYHQWSCAVITDGTLAHWKLWLDGAQLLFTGVNGQHTFNNEQYSFQTGSNDFTGDPYIGLGDLHNNPIPDLWDFEFDCVTYKDDGVAHLTCGITPTCDSIVSPESTQASTALRGSAATPPAHLYTVSNGGTTSLSYTAVEMAKVAPAIADLYSTGVDNSRVVLAQPVLDPHWTIIQGGMDGTCTQGAPCPAYTLAANPVWLADGSGSRWITAGQAGDGIAPAGDHVFRTTFTLADQAAVNAAAIKGRMAYDDTLVDVKLNGAAVASGAGVGFAAWQEFTIESGFQVGANTLDFTVRNGGTASNPMGLRVEFYDIAAQDVPWLALDKASGGPLGPGGTDIVTASIVDTDLPAGTYTAYVAFADSCTPAAQYLRQIDLTVIDCRSAVTPAGNAGRAFRLGSAQTPLPVSYTFQNTGAPPLNYTVTASAAWLQLDKTSGGPIASGGSDTITGTIDPTGLAAGGYACTLTFTDSCNPAIQHVRQVLLSVDETVVEGSGALQQFNAEFSTFTGSDLVAVSPIVSCDPSVTDSRQFYVQSSSGGDVGGLDPNWLSQGSINGVPTTALFNNPPGPASGGGSGQGRARFRGFLPFNNSFDPAKGMAVAWSMRVGSGDVIGRGPIQITFPRVAGPFGTDDTVTILAGETYNVYIRVQNGTDIRILNNGGGAIGTIDQAVLPVSIADAFHQWTAAVCYNSADQMAYWNLWVDGGKVMFGGANGSSVGPGGDVYSFRTGLENVTGDPYVGLGENNLGEDVWDFEFDWVRMLSYNVTGCPFWSGEACIPLASCNTPFADADGDQDVDMDDFAEFQRCINLGMAVPAFQSDTCRCFDRNSNKIVGDATDVLRFASCATGAGVPWQPSPGCE